MALAYDTSQLFPGKQAVIFHRTDGAWISIGGAANAQQQAVSAAVLSLGQYTLAERDKIEAAKGASLKPDSLTCQPRVFSPKSNSFSSHTTIFFTLDEPAHVSTRSITWLVNNCTRQTFGRGKQAIRWSGRDGEGEVIATGLYSVTVMVGDQTQSQAVNVWNH